jgi:hypothetical protein
MHDAQPGALLPTSLTQLNVFVSTPTSMDVQRRLVTTIIENLPEAILEPQGLRLRVLNWTSDITPGVGTDAQNVISSQIKDDYDIYIGILGSSFGSPTPRAGSGTEEEFDAAYARYVNDPGCVRILFYFMKGSDDVFAIDFSQLEKVKAFQRKLRDGGVLYQVCSDNDALTKSATNHLILLCQKQWTGRAWEVLSPRPQENRDIAGELEHTIVTQLADAGLDEMEWGDEEPGFLDIVVLATEALDPLLEILGRMTMHHETLTAAMVEPTNLVSTGTQTPQKLKWAVDEVAESLRTYVRDMKRELAPFKAFTEQVVQAIPQISRAHFEDNVGSREVVETLPAALASLTDGMRSARSGISNLRGQIISVPGFTRRLKTAQRLAVELLDEYLAYMTVMLARLDDDRDNIVESLLSIEPE